MSLPSTWHLLGEQLQGGEMGEREAEQFMCWQERQIWGGKSSEERAKVDGLLPQGYSDV